MRRRLYESNSNLFGVKLYDPYSSEYVVYWSEDRNIVREIYNTLRDNTWIRYDDLYDFVYQINPKFNKFTWEDIGFEWDGEDAFISDGVHESEGEIDIIYELPLDTKHRTESVRRRRRSNESFRMSKSNGKKCYIVVDLEKAREPKIIGVFLNKQHAEKAAYEVPNQWRSIIETTIQQ